MSEDIHRQIEEIARELLHQPSTDQWATILPKVRALYEKLVILQHLCEDTPSQGSLAEKPSDCGSEGLESAIASYVLPSVEPFETNQPLQEEAEKRTLNDLFSTAPRLALNDRIAFIQQLFSADENAFLKALQHMGRITSLSEAMQYVDQELKPKFDGWVGKESYEKRFKEWLSKRWI